MTSETREISNEDGQPIAFFQFLRDTVAWRYTSADRDQVLDGNTYTAARITRGKIEQGVERKRLALTITLPSNLSVAANWRPYASGEAISITVRTVHAGEITALVDWVGRVVSAKFDGPKLTITCEPSTTRNRRPGLHRGWQRGCGHVLYSQGDGLCNVNPATHAVAATLTAVSGLNLTATAFGLFPDGRLVGGFIRWTRASDGLSERRSINAHVGSVITVDYGAADLAVSLAIGTVLPGCKHDPDDCDTYFSNGANYGGQKDMPQKNPYDGDPVQ